MRDGWKKLAILGSTYARALGNAAQRAGRDVGAMQPALTQIAAQPQAKLKPGLSSFMREPGALPQTPQRAQMQDLAHRMPWAGDEHAHPAQSATAVGDFNHLLKSRGLEYNTPAGQPNTHQQIAQQFGDPLEFRRQVRSVDQPPRPAPPVEQQTNAGSPAARRAQTPRPGPAPAPLSPPKNQMQTSVLPAPLRAPVSGVAHAMTNVSNPRAHAPTAPMNFAKVADAVGAAASAAPAVKGLSKFLPHAVGIGAPLALGAGMLATKPGIQSNVKNLFSGKGSTEEQDKNNELPEAALHQADAIHQALLAHGLDPRSMRIGIDAPPGSGKTTLARALAQQTGMTHYGLDWEPGNAWKSTIGLGRNVEKMPHAPRAGEIMEHYLLNRTHDPELFDAQIHLKRDPKVIRDQLTRRGNAAYIGDTMDLDKSLGVADLGFDTLGGDAIDLGNGTYMKLRPKEGWGNNLDQLLAMKGINPEGLSRHEKLLSLHGGKRTTGAGWTPYVKNPFSTGETLALGASIPLGVMAARAIARRPR